MKYPERCCKKKKTQKCLCPIFVKNRTSSACIRLKKFFQTIEIIKHWSITSGEVNSSSLESFKNLLDKQLSKLTNLEVDPAFGQRMDGMICSPSQLIFFNDSFSLSLFHYVLLCFSQILNLPSCT